MWVMPFILLLVLHLVFKERSSRRFERVREENVQLKAQLVAEKVVSQNYRQQLEGLDERLTNQFKTASLELFKENAKAFVQLSEEGMKHYNAETKDALSQQRVVLEKMMEPLKIHLEQFTTRVEQLELGRQKTDVAFKEQLQQLNQIQLNLENKTDLLTRAFCNPNQRGRWGELQLRRIVEMSGLIEHVDFDVQVPIFEGILRPDMVIHLPNDRCVIVDSKTPQLEDYLSAVQSQQPEETQKKVLRNCCQRIRDLVAKLSAKHYGAHLDHAIDFVVLFFPGEWIFSHALQVDSNLIEYGCQNNVIFATPTTLIALLKSIHYGWRQNKMVEEMRDLERVGSELYERMLTFNSYLSDLRRNLSRTVDSYNQVVGSLESRMMPAARKFSTFSKKNVSLLRPEPLEVSLKMPRNNTTMPGQEHLELH